MRIKNLCPMSGRRSDRFGGMDQCPLCGRLVYIAQRDGRVSKHRGPKVTPAQADADERRVKRLEV